MSFYRVLKMQEKLFLEYFAEKFGILKKCRTFAIPIQKRWW